MLEEGRFHLEQLLHLKNHLEKLNVWYIWTKNKLVICPHCRKFPVSSQVNFTINNEGIVDKTSVAEQIKGRNDNGKFPETILN